MQIPLLGQTKKIYLDGCMENAKISIAHEKSCECPKNHINCLTAKEWVKNQVAIWEFFYEKRDIRDKNIHPAVFPIALPARCIELFTHKGELVLDPFAGIGTTLLAAQDLERNAVGFDLKKEYVEFGKKRLQQRRLSDTQQFLICGDAHSISNYLEEETVALCVTSPPYANMLNKPRRNKSLRGDMRNNGYYLQVQQYSKDCDRLLMRKMQMLVSRRNLITAPRASAAAADSAGPGSPR
jgi:DNA modification methylase